MQKKLFLTIFLLVGLSASLVFAQANIATSLHYTRAGKNTAYIAENGGMELITNIKMADLTCQKCHSTTEKYPNGSDIDAANYAPSCNDCHNLTAGYKVEETTCLNCHNRQVYERAAYPDVDVHKKANLTCTSCHTRAELHGDDGVAYASLKEKGAIKVECQDCHKNLASNTSHDLHSKTVDCAACHTPGILTCTSCHFESLIASGKNRALNQIKNYSLLVKKDGKIRLGGFMTHTYNGKTNYIISSYHSHAIQKASKTCADCHQNMGSANAAIGEYNTSGTITLTKWNEGTKKMGGPTGVVPVPVDWKTAFKLDYAVYNGDPAKFPTDANAWSLLKSETDNMHLFYAEPLDTTIMKKLGFTRMPTAVDNNGNQIILSEFKLKQNYPNPFNPQTTIEFSIEQPEKVNLTIYDMKGREIAVLMNQQEVSAGNHKILFDAAGLASGMYLYVLSTPNFQEMRKMVLMK